MTHTVGWVSGFLGVEISNQGGWDLNSAIWTAGDILFSLKYQSCVAISEEAPGSGSLYTAQLVGIEGRPSQTLLCLGHLT